MFCAMAARLSHRGALGGKGGDFNSQQFELHWVVCESAVGNVLVVSASYQGHYCFVVAQGKVPGPCCGCSVSNDFPGRADVVQAAAAHLCCVWVVGGYVVLLRREVLVVLRKPIQDEVPPGCGGCLALCGKRLIPVCSYNAGVML